MSGKTYEEWIAEIEARNSAKRDREEVAARQRVRETMRKAHDDLHNPSAPKSPAEIIAHQEGVHFQTPEAACVRASKNTDNWMRDATFFQPTGQVSVAELSAMMDRHAFERPDEGWLGIIMQALWRDDIGQLYWPHSDCLRNGIPHCRINDRGRYDATLTPEPAIGQWLSGVDREFVRRCLFDERASPAKSWPSFDDLQKWPIALLRATLEGLDVVAVYLREIRIDRGSAEHFAAEHRVFNLPISTPEQKKGQPTKRSAGRPPHARTREMTDEYERRVRAGLSLASPDSEATAIYHHFDGNIPRSTVRDLVRRLRSRTAR